MNGHASKERPQRQLTATFAEPNSSSPSQNAREERSAKAAEAASNQLRDVSRQVQPPILAFGADVGIRSGLEGS